MIASGVLGIALFPRLFYGFSAARAIDKERNATAPLLFGPGSTQYWDASPTENEKVETAWQGAQGFGPTESTPDATALKRLAQEERAENP
jgi:hypothetical protein